ncbi:hypothetical protein YC2023_044364 [Brassica napus]
MRDDSSRELTKQFDNETASDQTTLNLDEKTDQLPRAIERRAPSNPECYDSYNFRLIPHSEPKHRIQARAPKPSTEEETTGEITASIAFHQDRIHPSNRNPYREDGSKNRQPSGGDKTKAWLGACSPIISQENHTSCKQPQDTFTMIKVTEQATTPSPHISEGCHEYTEAQANAQANHRQQNINPKPLGEHGQRTQRHHHRRNPTRHHHRRTRRRILRPHSPLDDAKRETRPTRRLTVQHAPPCLEKDVFVTEKFPVTLHQTETDPDAGRSRPQATPATEKPRSDSSAPDLKRRHTSPSTENNA